MSLPGRRLGEEAVFRALAHGSRREILEALRSRPGLTLKELCRTQRIARQGVSQHLDVLANAGLVVSRRVGREKLHYLNAVPIAEVFEGWMQPFLTPAAHGVLRIRERIEAGELGFERTEDAGA